MDIANLSEHEIARMGDSQFKAVMTQILSTQELLRKESALTYYEPVSEESKKIHLCT